MNEARKAQVEIAIDRLKEIEETWVSITELVQDIRDEEKEEFENLPDGTSDKVIAEESDRVDSLEDAIEYLDGAVTAAIGFLQEAINWEEPETEELPVGPGQDLG